MKTKGLITLLATLCSRRKTAWFYSYMVTDISPLVLFFVRVFFIKDIFRFDILTLIEIMWCLRDAVLIGPRLWVWLGCVSIISVVCFTHICYAAFLGNIYYTCIYYSWSVNKFYIRQVWLDFLIGDLVQSFIFLLPIG